MAHARREELRRRGGCDICLADLDFFFLFGNRRKFQVIHSSGRAKQCAAKSSIVQTLHNENDRARPLIVQSRK